MFFSKPSIGFSACTLLNKLRTAKHHTKEIETEYLNLLAEIYAVDRELILYIPGISVFYYWTIAICFRIDDKDLQLSFAAHLKCQKLITSSNPPVLVDIAKYNMQLKKLQHICNTMKDIYASYKTNIKYVSYFAIYL